MGKNESGRREELASRYEFFGNAPKVSHSIFTRSLNRFLPPYRAEAIRRDLKLFRKTTYSSRFTTNARLETQIVRKRSFRSPCLSERIPISLDAMSARSGLTKIDIGRNTGSRMVLLAHLLAKEGSLSRWHQIDGAAAESSAGEPCPDALGQLRG